MNIIGNLCVLAAICVYAYYLIASFRIIDMKKLLSNIFGVIFGAIIVLGILYLIGGVLSFTKIYPLCVFAAIIFFLFAIRLIAPIAGVLLIGVIIYFAGSWILYLLSLNGFATIVGGALLIFAAKWLGYFTYGCADAIRK